MAIQTGRTVNHWFQFHIGNATNAAIRWIPVSSVSVLGHTFTEVDLTAWMDAVNGSLPNTIDAPVEVSGPWDTTADSTNDTAFSGSHTILNGIMAAQVTTVTPLTLDCRIGMRHTWETGEPNYGITATATSGYWLQKYTFDPSTSMYQAIFHLFPGSSLPAFGTSEETT